MFGRSAAVGAAPTLLDKLEGDEFREAFEQKFSIALKGRPTMAPECLPPTPAHSVGHLKHTGLDAVIVITDDHAETHIANKAP